MKNIRWVGSLLLLAACGTGRAGTNEATACTYSVLSSHRLLGHSRGEEARSALRTKADVIQYIKDSFAYLHKAVATIDDTNMVIESPPISPMPKGSATRLGLAVEVLLHTFDHYGQMVEYLRMNGIVPPASRLDGGGNGGM